MKQIGIVFSKAKDFSDPFSVMGEKRPVYEELVQRCLENDMEMVVVSKKGYLGDGKFSWYYKIIPGGATLVDKEIKLDLAYDRAAGLSFPVEGDKFKVVDNLDFKKFAWNKWDAYKLLGEFMPKTFWVGKGEGLKEAVDNIKTDWIVLKPNDGLKGKGLYVGPKGLAFDFKLQENKDYLAQEFIDTSKGIKGITPSTHDLRVVVINGKMVWSHVRTPSAGQYKANVAAGGTLIEVSVMDIPNMVTEIVQKVSNILYDRYDNPIYSIDFGIDRSGRPYVFEINDQIGFPKESMQAKDMFLSELVKNFTSKI